MDIEQLRKLINRYDQAVESRREHFNQYTSDAYYSALRQINNAGGWEKIAKALLEMVEAQEAKRS